MHTQPDQPDPSPYIGRLANRSPFDRETAAWSLGEIGSPRAARPLAGLLLRELQTVERYGYIAHDEVVRRVVEAIRRIGSTEALYALMKSLCVLSKSKGVDRGTIEEILEAIAAVGGFHAVRESADRVVSCAADCDRCPGLQTVAQVVLERLALCGDAATKTLRRLARGGPQSLRPIAHALV